MCVGIHLQWDVSSENIGNPQDTQGNPNCQSGVGIVTHLLQESGSTESLHLLHRNRGKLRLQLLLLGSDVLCLAGLPDKHGRASQGMDFTDPRLPSSVE